MTQFILTITGDGIVTRPDHKKKDPGDRRKMKQDMLARKLAEKETQNDSGITRS